MIKSQILLHDFKDIPKARETLSKSLKYHPKSTVLWIMASRLEEMDKSCIKARAALEKARILCPKDQDLWVESVNVESRAGNGSMAKALVAKGLQTCPSSGKLWSLAIIMESRPQRKARSADALKNCENDSIVVCTIARLFWSEHKLDKARNWFMKSVAADGDLGDNWAWWYKFEMMHGTPVQQEQVLSKCISAEPKHGDLWQVESKSMKNVGISCEQILKLVAMKLENKF
jgi:pre-mRNA-processing factor 6